MFRFFTSEICSASPDARHLPISSGSTQKMVRNTLPQKKRPRATQHKSLKITILHPTKQIPKPTPIAALYLVISQSRAGGSNKHEKCFVTQRNSNRVLQQWMGVRSNVPRCYLPCTKNLSIPSPDLMRGFSIHAATIDKAMACCPGRDGADEDHLCGALRGRNIRLCKTTKQPTYQLTNQTTKQPNNQPKETTKQTNKQTNKQPNKQTNKQTNKHPRPITKSYDFGQPTGGDALYEEVFYHW